MAAALGPCPHARSWNGSCPVQHDQSTTATENTSHRRPSERILANTVLPPAFGSHSATSASGGVKPGVPKTLDVSHSTFKRAVPQSQILMSASPTPQLQSRSQSRYACQCCGNTALRRRGRLQEDIVRLEVAMAHVLRVHKCHRLHSCSAIRKNPIHGIRPISTSVASAVLRVLARSGNSPWEGAQYVCHGAPGSAPSQCRAGARPDGTHHGYAPRVGAANAS